MWFTEITEMQTQGNTHVNRKNANAGTSATARNGKKILALRSHFDLHM